MAFTGGQNCDPISLGVWDCGAFNQQESTAQFFQFAQVATVVLCIHGALNSGGSQVLT